MKKEEKMKMKKEQEMLELFHVEELEKRYEMGWLHDATVSGTVNSDGTASVTVSVKIGK